MFTAFALLLVVGIAQLMTLAGVSMALGAFLAGVLLASSEYRHALETDIEPFKGLLMGLFFIAVGMSIDFGLLAQRAAARSLALRRRRCSLLKGAALALLAPRARRRRAAALAVRRAARAGRRVRVRACSASRARRACCPATWDALLTLVVALSMALTPLLLLAARQAARARAAARRSAPTTRSRPTDAPVIIAGFGRFGQIVGRLLFASGMRATVLDHDPDQIELLRKFGFRVFYGDATRLDLLRPPARRDARLLVNAIDDVDDSLALVDRVREHFPHLPIVARARNVTHYFELRARGVTVVERETFESALRSRPPRARGARRRPATRRASAPTASAATTSAASRRTPRITRTRRAGSPPRARAARSSSSSSAATCRRSSTWATRLARGAGRGRGAGVESCRPCRWTVLARSRFLPLQAAHAAFDPGDHRAGVVHAVERASSAGCRSGS